MGAAPADRGGGDRCCSTKPWLRTALRPTSARSREGWSGLARGAEGGFRASRRGVLDPIRGGALRRLLPATLQVLMVVLVLPRAICLLEGEPG